MLCKIKPLNPLKFNGHGFASPFVRDDTVTILPHRSESDATKILVVEEEKRITKFKTNSTINGNTYVPVVKQ
jgi:hypothetical protein